MKALFFAALSFTICAQAGPSIKDPALLGQYTLVKPNAKSELKTAKLVYNHDNVLVVMTDRNDSEYEISEPNEKGVIFDFQDEPNCDGDEPHCFYDSQVTVKLGSGKDVNDNAVPQILIEITVSDAWDDSGVSYTKETYVLNWSKALADANPYYLNVKAPADLAALSKKCKATLAKIAFDDKVSYLNSNDICPYVSAFEYRASFKDAFTQIKTDWVGEKQVSKVKLLTPTQVKAEIFDKAKALAAKYKAKGPVTSKMIIEQINKIEAYVASKSKVYAYQSLRGMSMFVVDEETKIITHFDTRTTTE